MSENDTSTDGTERPTDGPQQDWCDWCDEDGVEITHVVSLDRFSFDAYFCSRDCAESWGCAADQDEVERISGRPITDGGVDSPANGTERPSGGAPQELVVEFTQRFTVKPPEDVDDPVYAEGWFWNIYPEIGYDVIDARRQDHYEVVDVRERDSDE